jgi:hypothetical protein
MLLLRRRVMGLECSVRFETWRGASVYEWNGNGSVSFGNEKNMKGGGRDVLRSVWNGIFSGVKAVRRVYALDGSCVCMCPFPFFFFFGLG